MVTKKKRKEKIDVNLLDPRSTLEEIVACSRLGRTMASFGAILTGREKRYAPLIYNLLKIKKHEFSERWNVMTQISRETNSKKLSPTNAIKWFAKKYPKEAEPLLAYQKKQYEETETAVQYGLKPGRNLPDDYYVKTLKNVLEIPDHEATILYHGILKSVMQRIEEESLTKFTIKD